MQRELLGFTRATPSVRALRANTTVTAHQDAPAAGENLPIGAIVAAMRAQPAGVRTLLACTVSAAAAAFEPGYLTLSTSVIQTGLRAPNSSAPLMMATAFLVLAVLTLAIGSLADAVGRRIVLRVGLAGLTLANAAAMVALHQPGWFAVADTLTTTFGAIVLPASMAIVTLAFAEDLRPFAYGVMFGCQGLAMASSPLLIPLLGGWWDGRASFVPVLGLLVAAQLLVHRHVPARAVHSGVPHRGMLLNVMFVAGLFTVLFLTVTLGIRSGTTLIALAVAAGLLLMALSVRGLARRSKHFVGVELYGGRDLGLAIFAGLMLVFAQGCFFYQIYPYFTAVQQVGEVMTALRYTPYVGGLVVGGLIVARLMVRFGARPVLAFSVVTMGLGLLGLAFVQVDTPFWAMIAPITLIGLAAGVGGPVRTAVVMAARPLGMVGQSAAINIAAGQSGYALGVIISSVLVTQHADRIFVEELYAAGVPEQSVQVVVGLLSDWTARLLLTRYPALPDAVQQLSGVSYAAAFTTGLNGMFAIGAVIMFVTAASVFVGMTRAPAVTSV